MARPIEDAGRLVALVTAECPLLDTPRRKVEESRQAVSPDKSYFLRVSILLAAYQCAIELNSESSSPYWGCGLRREGHTSAATVKCNSSHTADVLSGGICKTDTAIGLASHAMLSGHAVTSADLRDLWEWGLT
jgi:hypothetical protein